MPAQRTNVDQPITVRPGDMLGKSDGSSDLMVHAMLFDEESDRFDVTNNTNLRTAHMGPPLGNATRTCDAVGGITLTDDQKLRIKEFIARNKDSAKKRSIEYRRRGQKADPRDLYVILPAAKAPSGDFIYWRFSCVGFVLKAYEQIQIQLLSGPIPERRLEELKTFYPWAVSDLDDASSRERFGIGAGDRWRVELVGYLLHSLARDESKVIAAPYTPQRGDEYFPRQSASD